VCGTLLGRWWFSSCLPSWFRSSSPFKAFDLWFLSDLLRSADYLAFVSPPSRRWSWGCFGVSVLFFTVPVLCVVFLFALFVFCSCLIRDWVTSDVALLRGSVT
jgi:hypothetical protein